MRPPYRPASTNPSKVIKPSNIIKSSSGQRADGRTDHARLARTFRRFAAFCLVAGLVATALLTTPSSASFGRLPAAVAGQPGATATGQTRETRRASTGALPLFGALISPLVDESIETYAADCTTPKTTFSLGETVCAKVVGAPIGSPVQRRFVWAANSGNTVRTANILTPVQTDLYTLPSTPTSTINGLTIDNRGKWRVNINDTSEGAVRASAFFIVRDPAKPTVNLSVNQTIAVADAEVNAGANIASTLYVNNPGPDNAQNAQLSVSIPANTTFVSATQDSGPAFNCATPPAGSTLNCTNSSLATGAQAVFTVVYKVDQNTPVNTVIVNTSSVSSSTTELNTSDNSSSIRSVVRGVEQTEVECAYTCPGNITQPNDPGQAGAVVNYSPVGSSDASCTATCSRLSGSFFPIGTTTVTCGDDTASCTFDVTVQDTRAVRITLNGASTLEVECHDAFTDPGATAVDPSGNPLEVTTSGSVDANTPNAYTLTYTATDGTTTATETRTVNVVDTQVPTITLNGDDEVTIECHGSFTDPGATAEDTCA
ncbi:MAG TPA: immunoglobulin-like domain-containing protein, partial [Pyrinomonadaceae bacterium]|nr:immunoglobulin-like domain-containing protein [Pyrinomonadaceae bacterium]